MIDVPSAQDVSWRDLRGELVKFVAARVTPGEVDDVVQDALAKIHAGVGGVRDHERLGAWMYRIARNAIVDHHRRTRTSEPLSGDEPERGEPDEEVLAGVLAPCLAGFVAMLPPVYRQAITLVELEGLSQVAAAERLGVRLSTMKSRVQRGRSRLREIVEECCAIGLDARNRIVEVTPRGPRCKTC